MSFKYSQLIHACSSVNNIPDDCYLTYYVKEIFKRQVGVNGQIIDYAQLYATDSNGNQHYHGPYAVDLNGVDGDKIIEAEKQIQQLPEFKGELNVI
ncbi:hypothetical protein [Serratia liquefaciens]|uniref:hypothetical protein n=1 Tax=Serratia liquefaciens TaxID=614 RepID=UPI003EC5EAE8